MFPPSRPQDSDAPIRLTDTDAAVARLSAVQKGYLQDDYVKYLVPRAHLQPPRPPLINVGTFVRTTAIDDLVRQWLRLSGQSRKPCQIVSLGAGSDTRFWRISTGPDKDLLGTYIELDFPEITSKKAMAIRKSKELSSVLGQDVKLANGGTALHSPKYYLLPIDLRLSPNETLSSLLASSDPTSGLPILSRTLPTLLLFECVLVYMSPSASSAILQWFVDYLSHSNELSSASDDDGTVLGSVVYEMFGLGDAFGRVMLNNLKTRNVSLPGAEPYPSVGSLPNRFLEHGFTATHALTLRDIRREYIDRAELERISTLEMLDEIEELELVLEHYGITWGLKTFGSAKRLDWLDWGLKHAPPPITEPQ